MKRSKFTDAQIAFVLQQADERVLQRRNKYAVLMLSEMKRLKQLEKENGKPKRLIADLSLNKAR